MTSAHGALRDRLLLVAGVAFCAGAFAISLAGLVAGASLPDEPERYVRWMIWIRRFAGIALTPFGFAVAVLSGADMARAADLRSRRARLRLASIAVLIGLASIAGVGITPHFDALQQPDLDGAALQASRDAVAAAWWLQRALVVVLAACLVLAHRAPATPAPAPQGDRYAAAWVPPIFGATPLLPRRQWQVLGLMVVAGLFNSYDGQIFSLALKQIQAGLGIEEARLGLLGSIVRLGVIPGALLALCADVIGRRRVLLWTIAGYTLCTGATAFAPNEASFVALQLLQRAFGAAETTLAFVVVAEEIDAEHRGWAMGVVASLAFLGIALAWILFAMIEVLPLGWRTLYLVGIGPLGFLMWLRRRLPETARFAAQPHAGPRARAMLEPVLALARAYPRRFAVAGTVGFLMAFSGQSAGFFFPKMMQDVHGFAPDQLTLVGAAVGFVGLCAMPLVGRLGDRRGRKPVAIAFILLNPLTVIGLYLSPFVPLVLLLFLGMTLTDIGSDTNLRVFGKELFPTSHRATANGVLAILGTLGASLGLAAESALYGQLGSHGQAIAWIACTGLLVPILVAVGYPETRGRSLEDIAPEAWTGRDDRSPSD